MITGVDVGTIESADSAAASGGCGVEESASTRDVVVVRRWKRYGHDRAYVEVNGREVGYRDLGSEQVICDDLAYSSMIVTATEALVERARAARYEPRHASPPATRPDVHTVPQTPVHEERLLLPDMDLADNVPGQSIRTQAQALRAAAPVRTALARVLQVHNDERAFRIGADAEVEVARRLAKLGPDWRVLHSIPVGERGSDIDHLVIGPAGVFTINTKNHPTANVWVRGDTFKVNGQSQTYVRNSRFEATRASKALTSRANMHVDVRGIIAVMGATGGFVIKEQPADGRVVVVRRKEIARHLVKLPTLLDSSAVERIYQVARHLATWQPTIVGWADF